MRQRVASVADVNLVLQVEPEPFGRTEIPRKAQRHIETQAASIVDVGIVAFGSVAVVFISALLMVILYSNVVRVPALESERDAPLAIHADRIVSFAITMKAFQAVGGRSPQVIFVLRGIQQ